MMRGNGRLKTRKWYTTAATPPLGHGYIVMTDMGFVFEASFEKDGWHVSETRDGKVRFALYGNQDGIAKWMKVK